MINKKNLLKLLNDKCIDGVCQAKIRLWKLGKYSDLAAHEKF